MGEKLKNFVIRIVNVFKDKRMQDYVKALLGICAGYACNVTIQCLTGQVVYEPPLGAFALQFALFVFYIYRDKKIAKNNSAEGFTG